MNKGSESSRNAAPERGVGRRSFLQATMIGGVAAAGGLAAPAIAQGAKRKVIFVAHEEIPFFAPIKAGFKDFGALRDWDMQYLARGTPANVAETVRLQVDALNAKPDAVGFTRINETAFDENIMRAKDAGIPVVLFNVASTGYEKLEVPFVGQDFIPAGRVNGLQASTHAHKITGKTEGTILVDNPAPGVSALEERAAGTDLGIAEYNQKNGTTFKAERFTSANTQTEALSRIDAKMRSTADVVAFASTVSGHWFTALWAEDNGMTGKFANGGFDLIPGVLQAIAAGTAQWSVGQNPYAQGWVTSALIDMQLESGFQPYGYDTGAEVVDMSNIEVVAKREARFG
jgi:ribose transport system substrate-binding protein